MAARRRASGFGLCLVSWLGMAGCAEPCDDLQRICDRCIDPNQRAACEAAVDSGDPESCQVGVDDFTNVCK